MEPRTGALGSANLRDLVKLYPLETGRGEAGRGDPGGDDGIWIAELVDLVHPTRSDPAGAPARRGLRRAADGGRGGSGRRPRRRRTAGGAGGAGDAVAEAGDRQGGGESGAGSGGANSEGARRGGARRRQGERRRRRGTRAVRWRSEECGPGGPAAGFSGPAVRRCGRGGLPCQWATRGAVGASDMSGRRDFVRPREERERVRV